MTGEVENPQSAAPTPDATPAENQPTGLNLAPEALPAVDEGMLAAVRASVTGAPAQEAPPGDAPVEPAVPVEPAATPEGAAAEPPAKPDKPAEPSPRPSDEFGALPQDAKAETKERFEKLRTSYDEKVAALTAAEDAAREAREQVEGWRGAVLDTGATPEQFGMSLAFLKDLNSGTPEGVERAYEACLGQLAELAKALGREVPGVYDPLTGHADLQARLNDPMDPLTREDAVALANAKNRAKLLEEGQRASAQRTQAQDAEQQAAQAQQRALAEISAFGTEQRARDPLFAAKMAAIGPALSLVQRTLPPAQWAAETRRLYAEVVVAAPAAAPTPAGARVPNPLRPTAAPGGAGAVAKQPGSMLEAARMAIRGG